MVGVPGKYKGCNTCRARRVKCDNERPHCRKCLDTGRECQGYERETVFIVGTPEDKGRCSSHPPRNLNKSAKNTPSPTPRSSEEPRSHNLTPSRPFGCAWGGGSTVPADGGAAADQQAPRVMTLHVPLYLVGRINDQDGGRSSALSLPTYLPPDVRPRFREESFTLRSQCLVPCLDASAGQQQASGANAESVLLFLYEHNNSLPSWQDPCSEQGGGNDRIQEMGPGAWTEYPAHHFFTRVYRPSAVATAVLNRRPVTFGSEQQEWLSTPWQRYPKSRFDELLDIMWQIPSLLQRLDYMTLGGFEPSSSSFQDLLDACLLVQALLEQWHDAVVPLQSQAAFWVVSPGHPTTAEFPFTDVLSFRDGDTALLLLYYWAAQVSLYPCIELLLGHGLASLPSAVPDLFTPQSAAVDDDDNNNHPLLSRYSLPQDQDQQHQQRFCPDGGSMLLPPLPPPPPPPPLTAAPLPNTNYYYPILYGAQQVREIAANICRGLDFALQAATLTQPDLVAFPAQVAEGFYSGLGPAMAAAELVWLGRFRGRMALRGQEVAGVLEERRWVDLAEW